MGFNDGATVARKKLASDAGITDTVAVTRTGADLAQAALLRANSGATGLSGTDLAQRSGSRPQVIRTGEVNYAAAGGKVTRIVGKRFTGATAVQFGGTNGTAFSVIDDECIQVTTPAKGAGTYDLTVVHPDGNGVLTNGVVFI